MQQQCWGYKVEEKIYLGGTQMKKVGYHCPIVWKMSEVPTHIADCKQGIKCTCNITLRHSELWVLICQFSYTLLIILTVLKRKISTESHTTSHIYWYIYCTNIHRRETTVIHGLLYYLKRYRKCKYFIYKKSTVVLKQTVTVRTCFMTTY
jgi:hypothetical protein